VLDINTVPYGGTSGALNIIDGALINSGLGGNNIPFTGAIGMTGGLISTGSGSLTLGTNITYNSGATSVIAGTLNLGGAARTITVTDGPNIDDIVVSAQIIGTASGVTKAG